jgi:phosphohistidine phosphatase
MTILSIMRHAKSSWDQPGVEDFARPLNDRGRKAARRVGHELKHRHVRFDHVLASPAARVRETLLELADGYGELPAIAFDERLYGAGIGTLLDVLRSVPAQVHSPLLVGHNPGLHELVLTLTQGGGDLRRQVAAKFPTAAVAIITSPAERWDELEPGSGEIVELILPREVD